MHKGLKRILTIPFFIFSLSLFAQVSSVSPYSRFGIGDKLPSSFSRNYAIGGASMGLPQPLNIDLTNPASYTQVGLVTFEAGFEASRIDQRQQTPDDISVRNYRSGFRYLTAGVPVTNWWGSVVALRPYTFKGYNISTRRTLHTGVDITDQFAGEGGLNQIVWGNAFKVANGLSLGINASFLFGSVTEETYVNYEPTGFLDTRSSNNVTTRGIKLDYGLQYIRNFKSGQYIGAGISFSNPTSLSAEVENYQFTVDGTRIRDTLVGGSTRSTDITLPSELKIGFSYGGRHSQLLNPAWAVNVDFELYNGTEFENYNGSNPMQNGYKVQVGGFIVPRYSIKNWERSSIYFNNIEYRVGGYYEKTPLMLGGQEIPDYGITFGLGLPVRQQSASPGEVKLTTINVGAAFGQRGTLSDGLILEEYLNFYIGITFNDKWFIDYKYR